jgi:predicted dehydrogenase
MTIKVGILGFAHGHVNAYCNQWRDNPAMDIAVVAAWDHDAARLEQNAKAYGLRAESDADAVLKDKDITAVIVSAETSLHAEMVERAAAAGKAIIVQKPMALTMDEADRMVAAVNRHGVPFSMAWQMRVDPQNVEIKELIGSGQLGKIFMARRRHALNTHQWPTFTSLWHCKPELNRDIWADDASHAIDFIHWLLGVPESVTAEIDSLCDPRVPMDNGIAIYRYPGGPIAEVVFSATAPAAENTVEVIGEKGSLIQNYGDVPSCIPPRSDEARACGQKWYITENQKWTCSEIVSPPNHGYRIAGLAGPISDFLHGKRAAIATAEEGRTSLRMTLACYVSTREGRRVRLDDPKIQSV